LAENIILHDGSRVTEYETRIAHLEYQLDLLKRRLGADSAALEILPDFRRAKGQAVQCVQQCGGGVGHSGGRVVVTFNKTTFNTMPV
jgi:hypothetical protein